MRILSFFFILLGLTVIEYDYLSPQVQAQQGWNIKPGQSISGTYFDAYGVEERGESRFVGTLSNKNVHIGNFYAAGGEASHNLTTLTIDKFWVTSKTINDIDGFTAQIRSPYGKVDIKEFVLQVDAREINVDEKRTFGIADETLDNVTLTKTSVSNGTDIQTLGDPKKPIKTWGISGTFAVENYGTIQNAEVSGGRFANAGTVEHLTYSGGKFVNNGGVVQTLTLAAPSTEDWGSVDVLKFDGNGSGIITLTGFVENEKLGFRGIKVKDKVDFINGTVELDMTAVVENILAEASASLSRSTTEDWTELLRDEFGVEAFTAANIFGIDLFVNEDALKLIAKADRYEEVIVQNGITQDDWKIGPTGTPEPATLAVLGLGLAGLGWASRQRRK